MLKAIVRKILRRNRKEILEGNSSLHIIFLCLPENLKESEIVKTAITLKAEDDAEFIVQALSNLSVCIKYGNGQVPSKNFK